MTYYAKEKASDMPTPSSDDWGLYFKSDGLYVIDDAGVVYRVSTNIQNAPYGALYISSASVNTGLSTTPTLVGGTSTGMGTPVDFTVGSNNRLTYTGANTTNFSVEISASVTSSSGTAELLGAVYKDGSIVTGTTQRHDYNHSNRHITMTWGGVVSLSENNYIEPYIWLVSGSADITFTYMVMIVRKI